MTGRVDGDRITVVIKLPAGMAVIAELLDALGRHYPKATVETDHPDGWHIVCESTP